MAATNSDPFHSNKTNPKKSLQADGARRLSVLDLHAAVGLVRGCGRLDFNITLRLDVINSFWCLVSLAAAPRVLRRRSPASLPRRLLCFPLRPARIASPTHARPCVVVPRCVAFPPACRVLPLCRERDAVHRPMGLPQWHSSRTQAQQHHTPHTTTGRHASTNWTSVHTSAQPIGSNARTSPFACPTVHGR
jgi:hypothetical protein